VPKVAWRAAIAAMLGASGLDRIGRSIVTSDAHVDGNAVGGLMIDVFGREMTDARGSCAECGATNPLGALIAYTRAPGDVLRCPACGTVMLVAVALPASVRVSFAALRWVEPSSAAS
jgi:Family of unknown function (DUF6510)